MDNYVFANQALKKYCLSDVREFQYRRYTHICMATDKEWGGRVKLHIVTQPTGIPHLDRYLAVKQNMEYVQDDYV